MDFLEKYFCHVDLLDHCPKYCLKIKIYREEIFFREYFGQLDQNSLKKLFGHLNMDFFKNDLDFYKVSLDIFLKYICYIDNILDTY